MPIEANVEAISATYIYNVEQRKAKHSQSIDEEEEEEVKKTVTNQMKVNETTMKQRRKKTVRKEKKNITSLNDYYKITI